MSDTGTAGTEWGNGIESILKFDLSKSIISGGHTIKWSYKIEKLSNNLYQGINALGEKRVYLFSEDNDRLIHLIPDGPTTAAFFYRCS